MPENSLKIRTIHKLNTTNSILHNKPTLLVLRLLLISKGVKVDAWAFDTLMLTLLKSRNNRLNSIFERKSQKHNVINGSQEDNETGKHWNHKNCRTVPVVTFVKCKLRELLDCFRRGIFPLKIATFSLKTTFFYC